MSNLAFPKKHKKGSRKPSGQRNGGRHNTTLQAARQQTRNHAMHPCVHHSAAIAAAASQNRLTNYQHQNPPNGAAVRAQHHQGPHAAPDRASSKHPRRTATSVALLATASRERETMRCGSLLNVISAYRILLEVWVQALMPRA